MSNVDRSYEQRYATALDLLGRRRMRTLEGIRKMKAAKSEELRALGLEETGDDIQGGFATDRELALERESRGAQQDIGQEFDLEAQTLAEIRKQQKMLADKEEQEQKRAETAQRWKLGGMAAGALLAPFTAGASLSGILAGAGTGSQAGAVMSGVLGYDDLKGADVGGLLAGIGQMRELGRLNDVRGRLKGYFEWQDVAGKAGVQIPDWVEKYYANDLAEYYRLLRGY